ncbi:MAG: cytochrome c [Flavobacteriales bacterium]|nr:cytochrome c [Flavobacteriales bacterium]
MIKQLLTIFTVILCVSCGGEQQPRVDLGTASVGRTIYLGKCNACHGNDGAKGLGGAKDLSTSVLTNKEVKEIVTKGKGSMAGYGSVLSEEEVNQVIEHVNTLRK